MRSRIRDVVAAAIAVVGWSVLHDEIEVNASAAEDWYSRMDHWFSVIAGGCALPANTVRELDDAGFVVVPGPVAPPQLSRLAAVYDAAVSAADPADVGRGRTTTRVWDFVNRGPDFDDLYVYPPVLEACLQRVRVARTWGQPDEGAATLDSGRLHPP